MHDESDSEQDEDEDEDIEEQSHFSYAGMVDSTENNTEEVLDGKFLAG